MLSVLMVRWLLQKLKLLSPIDMFHLPMVNCASLIEDGACLQIGVGGLTNALAFQLRNHKNLGLHTETFADGVLELIKTGVINGQNKKINVGKAVSSFLLRSKEVFDFVDYNSGVLLKDVTYTNNPYIIAQNPKVAL